MNRGKALSLITPVIDNEASEEDARAFFDYLERDEYVRYCYCQEKRIKQLLSEHMERHRAPDSLRQRIHTFIRQQNPYTDLPCPFSFAQQTEPAQQSHWFESLPSRRNTSYMMIAVVVLLAGMMLVFQQQSSPQQVLVEAAVTQHFELSQSLQMAAASQESLSGSAAPVLNGGANSTDRDRPPEDERATMNQATTNMNIPEAEKHLRDKFDTRVTVPELDGASFQGIEQARLDTGLETPVLSYLLPGNELVQIVPFPLNYYQDRIKRNKEAVDYSRDSERFYVDRDTGNRLVSWQQDEVWYTAVSSHHGDSIKSKISMP